MANDKFKIELPELTELEIDGLWNVIVSSDNSGCQKVAKIFKKKLGEIK